ncbi:hypothetical protein [Allokutzneria sp. NRRL B-24872]|uniref:hypothetical protein n=1 Tax=Allokutzneria sp. NRRL B-24872 TaxID=1137961 RepID=UPI000A376088|nr:hypothetical protein [Allokutzneria sp. NRRL B-24872]
MRSMRGKVGTVALLTLSTMLLSTLPAMARTDDRIYDGWDMAGAANFKDRAEIALCDEEPDNNTVYAEFRMYSGAQINLSATTWTGCAQRALPGEQVRSFRISEEGGAWSPLAILDRA